jgi:alpha-N-arabinofuranosidase
LLAWYDLHSVHIYTGSSDYWTNILSPHQAERAIAYTSTFLPQPAYTNHVSAVPCIAYDEWNVWYRTDDGALEERCDFPDALAVATYLNIFVRSCAWVTMVNVAQMVNAIAPIITNPNGAGVRSIYYPFLLHSETALDEAVDLAVTAPSVAAPLRRESDRWSHENLGPFCVLDAAATCDRDRQHVSLTVVNRNPLESHAAEMVLRDASFAGSARVRSLTDDRAAPTGHETLAGNVQLEDVSQQNQRVRNRVPSSSLLVRRLRRANRDGALNRI